MNDDLRPDESAELRPRRSVLYMPAANERALWMRHVAGAETLTTPVRVPIAA